MKNTTILGTSLSKQLNTMRIYLSADIMNRGVKGQNHFEISRSYFSSCLK